MSAVLIMRIANSIASLVPTVFNIMFHYEILPQKLINAIDISIYVIESYVSASTITNYRLVSITNVLCRIA